jgi:hypothetical protein
MQDIHGHIRAILFHVSLDYSYLITPFTKAGSEATSPARLQAIVVLLVINDCAMIQCEQHLLAD